jgi:hypothetical protein
VLARIVDTQLELSLDEEDRYQELERQEGKEVREMVITWEDALEERKTIDEARGEARGEAKALKALRRAIMMVAKHRPGSLSPNFEDKLTAINDLGRLDEILDQVEEAESIQDVDLSP